MSLFVEDSDESSSQPFYGANGSLPKVLAPPPVALPIELCENSVESLAYEHGGDRYPVYWALIGFFITALVALPVIKVETSISAAGLARPVRDRIEVRSQVSGMLRQLAVVENDQVRENQPLISIDSSALEERIKLKKSQQETARAKLNDLVHLLSLTEALNRRRIPGAQNHLQSIQALSGEIEALEGVRSALTTQVYLEGMEHLLASLRENLLGVVKLSRALDRANKLSAVGLIPEAEIEAQRYEFERAVDAQEIQIRSFLSPLRSQADELQTMLVALISEEKELGENLKNYQIAAPASGAAIGFRGLSPGSYVQAGQPIGYISASDDILVDVHVAPRDVGRVVLGGPVRIQVEAFPYTEWGMLSGVVAGLSEDVVAANSNEFRITVAPESVELRSPAGASGRLRKGMSVNVRFLLGERSLLSLLYDSARRWFDPTDARQTDTS